MRVSRYHMPTLKEAPKDAELASHSYLIRGGFIRQLAAGIYDFLPMGVKVLHKVEQIVREEMNRYGGIEVLLPAVQPSELWKESGRWGYYGPELLRLRDRHDREFCVGPTHEEVITDLVRRDVRSYRDLPINLYQIQAKFRDEIKPRGGLLRGREFIMKDAYSFDSNEEGAKANYELMYKAYTAIFNRCGLDFRVVEADTGNIGGSMSHEFQVVAETGEDYVLKCPECDFTVNQELGSLPKLAALEAVAPLDLEEVHTPDQKSVEEVAEFLKVETSQVVKTLICVVDEEPMAVLLRGDHELSAVKLRRALGADHVEMADDATVERVSGAAVGFAGPVGLAEKITVVADFAVQGMGNVVVGANKESYHLKNTNPDRDFKVDRFVDVRTAVDGDACPNCEAGKYSLFRGIEVGHIFYLGTKYSKAMSCTVLNENGKPQPVEMGCYGIGVTRIISAAIEQNHDDKGIVWPVPLAPFEVAVLGLQMKDEAVAATSESFYSELQEKGVDVLFDDRKQRPGFKFADAELIGFPYLIVVGSRGVAEGKVEVKCRRTGEKLDIPTDEAVNYVVEQIERERKGL
jgi:prolyl-tRNA synthetase